MYLTLEALRGEGGEGEGEGELKIFAASPIVKSFGTTVSCLLTHLLRLIK